MPPTSVAVLGSTGSIGSQTLDVVADRPTEFDVVAIGAARSVGMLIEQASRFRPEVVAIADASVDQGTDALDAAVRAQHSWADTAPRERAEILRKTFNLVTERKDDFARLMTLEMGKPIKYTIAADIPGAVKTLRWVRTPPRRRSVSSTRRLRPPFTPSTP